MDGPRGDGVEEQNSSEEGRSSHDSDRSMVNGFGGRTRTGSSSARTPMERQLSDHAEGSKLKVGPQVGRSAAHQKTSFGPSVSEKVRHLQSSLPPPPPPPPSNTQAAKNATHETSPAELPPPPPPPLPVADTKKLKPPPPARPPPPKTMPLPPPPPPLVVTPLPLADGVERSKEAETSGKIPLKRLSGVAHSVKEEEARGEESADGETSESVSTPDTVITTG